MRIHRLEIQAFGPFADRVEIDADALTAGGLFLVHGPTGSGKTSLLDAVCYALYADVPGARGKQGLRSDHAAPDVVPQVALEVTVGVRRLRITRSPAWQRPKRRGTGLTPVPAGVLLEELTGAAWRTLSTRNDEVAEVVDDVLGMGLAQFSKVVLLPQGGFAAFLHADHEERRRLLEQLFDIGVYRDVEDWLVDQRRSLAVDVERTRADLALHLTRVDDALAEIDLPGADDPDAAAAAPLAERPIETVPLALAGLSDTLGAALTAAMADSEAANGAERLARAALEAARAVDATRRRGSQAAERAAALAAATEAHQARLEALAAAERAATLGGHLLAEERALADRGRATEAVQHVRDAVASLGLSLDDEAERDLAARVHALDDVAADLAIQLDAARSLERQITGLDTRLSSERTRAAAAAAEHEAAVEQLTEAGRRADRLAALAAEGPERARRVEEAGRRLGVLHAAQADLDARAELAPRLVAARDGVLAAQAHLEGLLQRRLDGMAGQLAAGLVDEAACPVCGATEHPDPATSADAVPDDALHAAESDLAEARRVAGALDAEDTRLATAAQTRIDGLGGADRSALETELSAAEDALAAATDAAAAHDTARQELETARARAGALDDEQVRCRTRAAGLDERLAELTDGAVTVREMLAAYVDGHRSCPCGTDDARAHGDVSAALDDLVRAEDVLHAAEARLGTARTDLAAALTAAGFAGVDDARAARRTPSEVDRLRDEVAAHVRESDACRAVLEDPEVRDALAGDPPDLTALDAQAQRARRAVLAAGTAEDSVRRAVRVLDRTRPAVEAGCATLAALTARHARVRELADAVAGTGADNTLRMRLTSFVLAARLEKVALLANERLRVMGGGRYLLEHTDDRAARGARSGLGLRVLDQWTGRTRETASLSGGESFMASLALALGLADAVREEAGGLDLGTLFVDEGFGSLDEESLEQVLAVLDGLREGGRAVGVVSHVADLRTRIPHQAVVHKSSGGSTVEVRTAAESTTAA